MLHFHIDRVSKGVTSMPSPAFRGSPIHPIKVDFTTGLSDVWIRQDGFSTAPKIACKCKHWFTFYTVFTVFTAYIAYTAHTPYSPILTHSCLKGSKPKKNSPVLRLVPFFVKLPHESPQKIWKSGHEGFLEAPKWVQDPRNGPQMIPPTAPDWFESISGVSRGLQSQKRGPFCAIFLNYFDPPWPPMRTRSILFGSKWSQI